MTSRTTRLAGSLAAAVLLATGCGTAANSGHATKHQRGHVQMMRLQPVTMHGHVGRRVVMPTEDGVAISRVLNSGQQIVILPRAFAPRILVADVHVRLTWTNLTTVAQRVVFLQLPVRSVVIPPGGKWSWLPRTGMNIHYRDSRFGFQGTVDFNPA